MCKLFHTALFNSSLIWILCLTQGHTQDLSLFSLLGKIPNHEVTLVLDFESLNEMRKKPTTFPGEFQYRTEQADIQNWAVNISVRGRYRRMFCDFPPLRIEFAKEALQAQGLAPFHELKWVTHCFEDHESDESLLREYLAYCLYERLTPFSFRTQLLRVTYVNAKNRNQKVERFAFVLEDDKEAAQRLNISECKTCFTVSLDSLDRQSENRVAVFQYLIGNTDWSITKGQKNVKYFKPNEGGKIQVIPHDFDFSGFVDAGYSKPATGTKIANVRERAFLGTKATRKIWETTAQEFQGQRTNFAQIIQEFPHLSTEIKQRMLQYLDSFFEKDFVTLIEAQSIN